MFKNDILFWNVDTQVDFIHPNGKLYVPGAETIQGNLKSITEFAKNNNIQVINTTDFHLPDSKELSKTPDFINTFPEHCMINTPGADFIDETKPQDDIHEIPWDRTYSQDEVHTAISKRNIIIRKDVFDAFEGNPNTETIVGALSPKKIFVYGVTTNVCVDYAIVGLAKRGYQVFVIIDSIKELPNIPLPYAKWEELGVQQIKLEELPDYIA